jgi:hypothetical protein
MDITAFAGAWRDNAFGSGKAFHQAREIVMNTHSNISCTPGEGSQPSRFWYLRITAVVATLGLLVINLQPSTVARSRTSAEAPISIQQPRKAVPRLAIMEIVGAPVIDPQPTFFIGTGDGSAGFWTRP